MTARVRKQQHFFWEVTWGPFFLESWDLAAGDCFLGTALGGDTEGGGREFRFLLTWVTQYDEESHLAFAQVSRENKWRKAVEMTNLPRYYVEYRETNDDWTLKNQQGRTVRAFETKTELTKGGVLEGILGQNGGTVRIQAQRGAFQEERTYPRSRDPRESKG